MHLRVSEPQGDHCWAHCRAHSTGRLLLGTGHGGACCRPQHRALHTGVAFHSPTNKADLAFLSIVNFHKIHIKLYYWLCLKNFNTNA